MAADRLQDFITVARAVIDLADAVAWPAVALVALYLFRAPIKLAIEKRAWKGKAGPVELEFMEQQSSVDIVTTAIAAGTSSGHASVATNPLLEGSDDLEVIKQAILADAKTTTEEAKVPLLAQRLAEARFAGALEWINGQIYGSQIQGLRALASRGTVSIAEALEFYEDVRGKYREIYASIPFDNWLGFLERQMLVRREADTISITNRGRMFIRFIDRVHPGESRIL